MGMFDTMNQRGTPGNSIQSAVPNAVGQGFAQQQPVQQMDFQQKMQQRANPMMRARPAMSGGFNQQNSMSQTPNPMTGARPMMGQQPGMQGGSRNQIMQRQLAQKNQQAAAPGGNGVIGGSYNQLLSAHPQLQQFRQTGAGAGQDMSWMDKPGALSMGPSAPTQEQRPQYGLQDVASRMGYGGSSRTSLQNAPFTGENPGSNGFQSMVENMDGQRPDVMPRIGPSGNAMDGYLGLGNQMDSGPIMNAPIQMDENGLEPRRGPR